MVQSDYTVRRVRQTTHLSSENRRAPTIFEPLLAARFCSFLRMRFRLQAVADPFFETAAVEQENADTHDGRDEQAPRTETAQRADSRCHPDCRGGGETAHGVIARLADDNAGADEANAGDDALDGATRTVGSGGFKGGEPTKVADELDPIWMTLVPWR